MYQAIVEISDKPGQAFLDGLIPALICIIIVFVILIFIYLIFALLNKIKALDVKKEEVTSTPSLQEKHKKITLEAIQDEDMMVAVLIASIDYQQEINKDVRLIQVKRIN